MMQNRLAYLVMTDHVGLYLKLLMTGRGLSTPLFASDEGLYNGYDWRERLFTVFPMLIKQHFSLLKDGRSVVELARRPLMPLKAP